MGSPPMLGVSPTSLAVAVRLNSAVTLIALGLALLAASAFIPQVPVVTAIALIALGASIDLCSRVRYLGWPRDYLVAHVLTYAGLYVLLIATLSDAASRSPAAGFTTAQYLDLVLSAIVMASATRTCVAALIRSKDHAA